MWYQRKYHLDRMSLRELTGAYFQYPAIQVYIALMTISAALAFRAGESALADRALSVSVAAVAGFMVYPLVWYLMHRFMLHGHFLYRSPLTAPLWKRIHYDHHQDPNDLRVLFGALYTTLPTITIVALPLGGVIGGTAGAAAAEAAALGSTLFYEFSHCVQHLRYTPRSRFFRRIKQLHLLHHLHNENGNYGITNFFLDRLLSTYYPEAGKVPRSPTVFNLGYVGEECVRYPWVARLSESKQ